MVEREAIEIIKSGGVEQLSVTRTRSLVAG